MTLHLAFTIVPLVVLLAVPTCLALVFPEEPHPSLQLHEVPAAEAGRLSKAIPSSFILTTSLGVGPKGNQGKNGGGGSVWTNEKGFYDVSGSKDANFGTYQITSNKQPLDFRPPSDGHHKVTPNIRYFEINCKSGKPCSTIIPAMTTQRPASFGRSVTNEEVKKYLRDRFSLRNGFQYTSDFEQSGSSPQIDDALPDQVSRQDRKTARNFEGSRYEESEDYWPGASYRPQHYHPQQQNLHMASNGQVFKHEKYRPEESSFHSYFPIRPVATKTPPSLFDIDQPLFVNRPFSSYQTPAESYPDENRLFYPYGPPRPDESPIKNKPSSHTRPIEDNRPNSFERLPSGKVPWNRFGQSTVSQYDPNSHEWVRIHSKTTNLNLHSPKRPGQIASLDYNYTPEEALRASVGLTVLGFSDRRPHSSFSNFPTRNNTHLVEWPSAIEGHDVEVIETDGGFSGFTRLPFTPSDTTPITTTEPSDIPIEGRRVEYRRVLRAQVG